MKIPLSVSSVTLQFLFTALAGILLGPKYGALSQAVYVALGLVGLPVFTSGGGFSSVLSPTFGFLLGFILAAFVIGLLSRKTMVWWCLALACLAGLACLYAVGLPYMALILNVYLAKGMSFSQILMKGMVIFLPGDMLKIAVTVLLSKVLLPVLRKAREERKV